MSAASVQHPPIPYGRANFRSIRLDGCLYVDKTRFIRDLERERFVFFIRPRRFGKTLWLTMLNAYYDRAPPAVSHGPVHRPVAGVPGRRVGSVRRRPDALSATSS